ncbi:MAG: helix-turn-helix transcriptional regulator [Lachnospiraceae bacterium]|nr:helix-turn-helix transcriptional regulator [Lachnospiraceae bacterium]
MDSIKLGKFIQEQRKEKGLTQAQLAEKICVTDKAVSKWERGIGIPDISNIEALSVALDISFSEIMQCKKQEEKIIDEETINSVLDETLNLVKMERKKFIIKCIAISTSIFIGIFFIFEAINYMYSPFSIILNDGGANSTFISGKMPIQFIIGMLVVGIILLIIPLVGLIKTILHRKKREKNA